MREQSEGCVVACCDAFFRVECEMEYYNWLVGSRQLTFRQWPIMVVLNVSENVLVRDLFSRPPVFGRRTSGIPMLYPTPPLLHRRRRFPTAAQVLRSWPLDAVDQMKYIRYEKAGELSRCGVYPLSSLTGHPAQ